MPTMATITAARALTSGVMPSRTFEYVTMSRGLEQAVPDAKALAGLLP